ERPDRPEAANAEQQFLSYASTSVPAVEARGEFTVFGSIAFDVRIKQKQVTASDLHPPDFGTDQIVASFNLDYDGKPVAANGGFHRHLVHIRLQILFLLPRTAIEPLPKVSLAI